MVRGLNSMSILSCTPTFAGLPSADGRHRTFPTIHFERFADEIAVMRRRAGPLVQNSTIWNQHERQNSVRPLPPPAGEDWEGGERARSILFQWPDRLRTRPYAEDQQRRRREFLCQ